MNWRGILLALYVLVALTDAAGKILVRDPQVKDAVAHALARYDPNLVGRVTSKSANNLDIFRASSRNLSLGRDLYAEYPKEFGDRFKYSPTFALLFSPFAVVPWGISLALWNLLNALLLFYAIAAVLPREQANLALAAVLPEAWRNIQSAQSNCIVAGLIILAFVALRKRHVLRAAMLITAGTVIKLFPILAALFAIPARRRAKFAVALGGCLLLAALLPLIVTPPHTLALQYASWRTIELSDARERGVSVMSLFALVAPASLPNIALQLAGALLIALPLLRFPERWRRRDFSIQMLASVLLFSVLFNHQAERPGYVIAISGVALWYAAGARTRAQTGLFLFAFLVVAIASNFFPVPWAGAPWFTTLRLVVPCFLVWVYIQLQLNGLLEPGREVNRAERSVSAPQMSETRTAEL